MADARVIPLHAVDRRTTSTGAGSQRRVTAVPDLGTAAEQQPGSASEARRPSARTSGSADGNRVQAGPDGSRRAEDGVAGSTARAGDTGAASTAGAAETDWEARAAEALAFLRRRLTGDYRVDDFGFDPDLTDALFLPPLRPLYEKWFRVETTGLHNIPAEGGALVVANHSGTVPLDALMTTVAIHDHHPGRRHLRMLGADLVFRLPVVGAMARKAGHTLACNPDAERLLRAGEVVGVWPEGFKGIGKPFRDRYKLQRFGRGGFVSAALRTGVPIVPCSIVGAEETYPLLGDLKPLARLLGLPYFPITPLFPWLGPLGAIPLPSKWYIEFGEPIDTTDFGADACEDPMLVFNLTDQVRETIQQTLYRLLARRGGVFAD
ncbi:1-acyl-sn-glycerol-3-phosphate acyltransferase [Actinoalloteichus hoggarensis]|uniref:2-acyl-glycerophospho-ethanolamine acyltransferase n=1 Tax=Actinoalloteichus hoggarensis TaxID=1470176 RepID=A0A221VX31_9PSEU|nr:lysophospholipid acyltransferase family protein [Actinoalloteichus hoggarensis]ASO18110.1 2-acyl-glycerophospho-ethanolamine acyltransferase [Actinoalloteichus hoggarensis]MBB5921467.1 1-acyl-sn-glycerol-3-phosphate acyltransferase [Actinoalloteichus hoggarensis]